MQLLQPRLCTHNGFLGHLHGFPYFPIYWILSGGQLRYWRIIFLGFVLTACQSETDKLKRAFEKRSKQLEIEVMVAVQTAGQQQVLKPLAEKFGEQNCQSIMIHLDGIPYNLRRDPNNLLLPYRAEFSGIVTVLPCGHKIYIQPDAPITSMVANEKGEWSRFVDGEFLLSLIRTRIESDAKNRTSFRTSPSS